MKRFDIHLKQGSTINLMADTYALVQSPGQTHYAFYIDENNTRKTIAEIPKEAISLISPP